MSTPSSLRRKAFTRFPGNAVALVLGADDKVEQRTLQLGRALGNKWLVEEGLSEGDLVGLSTGSRACVRVCRPRESPPERTRHLRLLRPVRRHRLAQLSADSTAPADPGGAHRKRRGGPPCPDSSSSSGLRLGHRHRDDVAGALATSSCWSLSTRRSRRPRSRYPRRSRSLGGDRRKQRDPDHRTADDRPRSPALHGGDQRCLGLLSDLDLRGGHGLRISPGPRFRTNCRWPFPACPKSCSRPV